MLTALQQSSAKRVFYYFEQLCQIPHGSGNTKAISDYCVAFAGEHHLEYYQDALNNVIIIREAAKGYEDHPAQIIQGHLDMVCEKESDCSIDFEKEGLTLYTEDGYLKARGTTLGADDGIAIAFALALLEKEDLKSPRLEAVFTVDEETGMFGAKDIDLSVLQGRQMLNLDSEEEGIFLCGCAGGMHADAIFSFQKEDFTGIPVELSVHGLTGGHSGTEIGKGHGNAIQILGRVLYEMQQTISYGVCSISGGQKENAIPRETIAQLMITPEQLTEAQNFVSKITETLRAEYHAADAEVTVSLTLKGKTCQKEVISANDWKQIAAFLYLMPNEMQMMSADIQGLVETSLNAGILTTKTDNVTVCFSIRSSVSTQKRLLADRLKALTEALGGMYQEDSDYPAWEFKTDSPLRDRMVNVYEALFGTCPSIEVMHAGLECGLFLEKLPDLDCVSFGPQIDEIHTTRERLSIASTERLWSYMLKLLEKGSLC